MTLTLSKVFQGISVNPDTTDMLLCWNESLATLHIMLTFVIINRRRNICVLLFCFVF